MEKFEDYSGVLVKPICAGVLGYPHPSGVSVQEGALAARPKVASRAADLPLKNSYLGRLLDLSVEDVLLQA